MPPGKVVSGAPTGCARNHAPSLPSFRSPPPFRGAGRAAVFGLLQPGSLLDLVPQGGGERRPPEGLAPPGPQRALSRVLVAGLRRARPSRLSECMGPPAGGRSRHPRHPSCPPPSSCRLVQEASRVPGCPVHRLHPCLSAVRPGTSSRTVAGAEGPGRPPGTGSGHHVIVAPCAPQLPSGLQCAALRYDNGSRAVVRRQSVGEGLPSHGRPWASREEGALIVECRGCWHVGKGWVERTSVLEREAL